MKAAVLACGLLAASHAPEALSQTRTIGMYYAVWHCPSKAGTYDLSKILDSGGSLGPLNSYHWWQQPQAGYYCLSENDALLRQHATQLKEAGIDYIYVDITNWYDFANSDRSVEMVTTPFESLLRVWTEMGAANVPKVVPWVKVAPQAFAAPNKDMIEYVRSKMVGSPLALMYNSKPVVFIAPYDGQYATTKIAQYATSLHTINMWTQDPNDGNPNDWAFISHCQDFFGFKNARGLVPCNQAGSSDGQQISVVPAFAKNWISYASTAVPKFHGATFLWQMEAARVSGRQYITITGWNEWVVQRTSWKDYGDRLFTDQYDQEYNRDLEPASRSGDLYYQLLKRSVTELRANRSTTAVAGSPGAIRGVFDGVYNNRVNGWACSYGWFLPIDVHLYVGGPAGVGTAIGSYGADYSKADASAVAGQCGTTGPAYRFDIPLSLATRQAHRGKRIYIHGIHPTGAHANSLVGNSGASGAGYLVPAP
jgi:hypothetical protein